MWLKSIFLIFCLNSAFTSAQVVTISCNFRQSGADYPYTCDLTLINPNGLDNFDNIQGDHLESRGNDDVTLVNAYNQNSPIVPSIICRQFPNLRTLYLSNCNIQTINETAFAGCANLEQIMLSFNGITEIPAFTFRNSPNLEFLFFSNNQLITLHADSFAGTSGRYLALGMNRLTEYNPVWVQTINQTLEILEILANDFTTLPSQAFSNAPNLIHLDITGNRFTNLPRDVFAGLRRLELLYISDCGVPVLVPQWFEDLQSLDELHLEFNRIAEIPEGVFRSLNRLRRLFLGTNNITTLGLAPFGRNVANLEVVTFDNNPLIAVDREFVIRARFLDTLSLFRASCFDMNIYNIQTNRQQAMRDLAKCFANFGPDLAFCSYAPNADGDYSCTLGIRNPLGGDFTSVEGQHLADRDDSDVLSIGAVDQSTQIVPDVLCRQFTQLRDMLIMSSFIGSLDQQSFGNCRSLERLDLSYNEIRTIADNTFSNSVLLRELHLGQNMINQLSANSFAGTRIQVLDLSNNRLFSFSPEWDEPIASTLETLDLMGNQIMDVNAATFANLRALRTLVLSNNFLNTIDDDAFTNLATLEGLYLSSCGLSQLNPQWFRNLTNLRHLSLGNNRLTNFQPNIFNALTNLQEIFFYNNRIVEIRADSFGSSLPSIRTLYGSTNLINIFDPEILSRGNELTTLLFANNLCVNLNIFDVRGNPELVNQQLEQCTDNFAVEQSATCFYERMITGRIYWCQLAIDNPSGRDDFEEIGGDHLPGSDDSSISYVLIERQNTRIVPSIVCRQFSGLQIFALVFNRIDEITEDSFGSCGFLRTLLLMGSNIRRIPDRAFQGATSLQDLFLDANRIETIATSAFVGTQLHTLDLSVNEIHDFIPAVFAPIGSTLRILRLTENRLENLPVNAFDVLPNLVNLELNHNHFFTLPANLFTVPVNLEILQIANCGIQRLQPGLFAGLTNLVDLELGLNELDLLPQNIFDLPRLQTLGLVQNNIRSLDAAVFGRSLNSLVTVDASINRIDAVDPTIVSANSSINSLNLAINSCTDGTFLDIPNFRDQVLAALQGCVNNFNDVPISCVFTEDEAIYECEMTLNNTNDRLSFTEITGEHMEGHNDNFVSHIRAVNQNSRSIPPIICSQYRNVEVIYFLASNLEVISSDAIAGCENLYSINLSGNRIAEIPDGVFSGNPYLSALILASNELRTLRREIFDGTSVYYLDIENNLFREFNPDWLAPLASNLRYLILRNNEIRRFPPAAFSRFTQLFQLEFSGNENTFIPSDAFDGLRVLYDLEMANCGLMDLNPHWFKGMRFLNRLEVDMNGITELPEGIFDLPYLRILGVAFNRLRVLDSRAFGAAVDTIANLDAEQNEIDAIDRRIVNNGTMLTNLLLVGNTCIDANFQDVQNNLGVVVENLQGCFSNFDNL